MTWEEKFAAMKALCGTFNCSLMMREPGNWYVSAKGREVKNGSMLIGKYGNGPTPQEAVEDDWRQLAEELPLNERIVLDAYGENRREVRWNGYMWQDCEKATVLT